MEVLAVVGLVSNIVQFVDFGCRLISKSAELCQSSSGVLAENTDTEAVANHLVILNDRLRGGADVAGDGALKDLCVSCGATAAELLAMLGKVKVQGKRTKWKSVRKALRSVWSKEEVEGLERRLLSLRDELSFHVAVDIREQVYQFKKEQSGCLRDLESTTRRIVDAIDERRDIFAAVHGTQLTLMKDLHRETATRITGELKETGAEIVRVIRHERGMSPAEQDRYLAILPSVDDAAFNSRREGNDSPEYPECIPGTRVDILQRITTWGKSSSGASTFWLSGMAGTGKSTIARTIARELQAQNRLGASFFFSRGGGDLSHASKLITSIAMQLAHRSPSHKRYISRAVADHGNIATQILQDQWNHLVLQPLSEIESSAQSPLIFVLDALDECENKSDIQAILQLLAEAQVLRRVRLRVFITSRPETPVRHGFRHIQMDERENFILHQISPSIVDHDISIFLRDSLGTTGKERALGDGWPSEQSIERLVYSAGGLFIWAATACRFIREGRRFVQKRLDQILQDCASTKGPEEKLNEIYMAILRNSVGNEYDDQEKEESSRAIKSILGTIVSLFSPLSVVSLAGLLRISEGDICQTLDDLHSILEVPVDGRYPIRLHHPSFRDFLLNKDRCRDQRFWVNEMEAHGALVESCLRLMSSSLKRDICDLQAPGALSDDVEVTKVEQCLPLDLQYACRYWVQHLQQSKALLFDNGQVHIFLQEHMLHWLEALSLIGKISDSVKMVTDIQSMVAQENPSMYAMIYDARRFILYNQSFFGASPLQIYNSALIFSPKKSKVRRQFEGQLPRWVCRLPEVQDDWSSCLQVLEGHSDSVLAVAFSPDSQLLASASEDCTARLWDPKTGASRGILKGHSGSVKAIAFSPDSHLLASASHDRTVRLWDPKTGAPRGILKGHQQSVRAVAFSPDGQLLASASYDETVRLWDLKTGALRRTLKGHSHWVWAVAFSPDSQLLASASKDGTVRLWDPITGAPCGILEGHSDIAWAVAFSPDSQLLASASKDSIVKLWDPKTGTLRGTLEDRPVTATAAASSTDGQLLDSGWAIAIAFSPDSQHFVSTSQDYTVKLWDLKTGVSLGVLKGHLDLVWAVAFSSDSQLLASASYDRTVRLWDPKTGALLGILKGHSQWVWAVDFSPDSQLLASASKDGTIRLWDMKVGAPCGTLEGRSDFVRAVAFSPDSQLLASASQDCTVKLWNPKTGLLNRILMGHSAPVRAVAFSPDSRLLASASYDGTIRLWDPGTGVSYSIIEGHPIYATAMGFSPDSRLFASASREHIIRLWDLKTGAPLSTLKGHQEFIRIVAFSPDGQLLASASVDRTVKLWDLQTETLSSTLTGHSNSVRTMAFSPDSRLLASGSFGRIIRLWDPKIGSSCGTLEGHSDSIGVIAFSLDSRLLASSSNDRTIRLWDAKTTQTIQILHIKNPISEISFSTDGSFLKTNRGVLWLSSPRPLSNESSLSPHLYVNKQWITWKTSNILLLPFDYRAICTAVENNTVALGLPSGRVIFIEFDPSHL